MITPEDETFLISSGRTPHTYCHYCDSAGLSPRIRLSLEWKCWTYYEPTLKKFFQSDECKEFLAHRDECPFCEAPFKLIYTSAEKSLRREVFKCYSVISKYDKDKNPERTIECIEGEEKLNGQQRCC